MEENQLADFKTDDLSKENYETFDFHRPYVDKIVLASDNGKRMVREPGLIDVWFDSGAMSYAQWHYPFENQDKFDKHFPADFICEAIDQTRGWFYTLHAIATLVSDSVAYRNCVCLAHIVDGDGKKEELSVGVGFESVGAQIQTGAK